MASRGALSKRAPKPKLKRNEQTLSCVIQALEGMQLVVELNRVSHLTEIIRLAESATQTQSSKS